MTKRKSQKRKPLISALEPRILFDGAAVATAVDVLDNTSFDASIDSTDTNDATKQTADVPVTAQQSDRREIAFVDTSVEDYQTLVDGIGENVEVFEISSTDEIEAILKNLTDIDAIHILSHGNTGEITIGDEIINADTLSQFEDTLNSLKNSLTPDGDIMLYGCNVASTGEGQEFIDEIAKLTQADVAASDDITGSAALGGDWDLEVESGVIDTEEISVDSFGGELAGLEYADLSTWTEEGDSSANWILTEGSRTVFQTYNGSYMYYLSPESDYIDTIIKATISQTDNVVNIDGVDYQTNYFNDDDVFGFVLGYEDSNNHILLYWFGEDSPTDLVLYQVVNGVKTELATYDFDWVGETTYDFQILYSDDTIKIQINGDTAIEYIGTTNQFVEGKIGFYNYSQGGVEYGNVQIVDSSSTPLPPVANIDQYGVSPNSSLSVNSFDGLFSNDYDVNLDEYNLVVNGIELDGDSGTTNPSSTTFSTTHGTITVNYDGSFTYTPTSGYEGTDSFDYKLVQRDDSSIESLTATVNFGVFASNHAPTGITLSNNIIGSGATVDSIIGTFTTTDVDIYDVHDYLLISDTSGKFKIVDGVLKIASEGIIAGTYSIVVRTVDLYGETYDKTYSITVQPNSAPTSASNSISVDEATVYSFTGSEYTFSDSEDSFGGLKIITLPTTGTLKLSGVAISAGDVITDISKLTYTPDGLSSDSFSFQVLDDRGALSTATYVTNISVNDIPPTLSIGSLNTYTPTSGTITIAPNLTLTDPGNSEISEAKIVIDNYKVGDILSFTSINGIVGSWDPSSSTLTLSGNATTSEYEAALKTVKFTTTSSDGEDRVFSFTVGSAIPFEVDGSNHFYEVIDVTSDPRATAYSSGITWTEAVAFAETLSLYGMEGYLATITSAEENAFILDKLNTDAWIGASDSELEGTWKWVTGPEAGTTFSINNSPYVSEVTYENWNGGEPNDSGSNEDGAEFYGTNNGLWNDLPTTGTTLNYLIVEYGGMEGDATPIISGTSTMVVEIAPTTVNENESGNEDTTYSGNVLSNDSDGDGDTLSVTKAQPTVGSIVSVGTNSTVYGSYGILTISSDGSYSYEPNDYLALGENAVETFTITVSDGTYTTTSTLTFNLSGVNDAPTLSNTGIEGPDFPVDFTFTEDGSSIVQSGYLSAFDYDTTDTATASISLSSSSGSLGDLTTADLTSMISLSSTDIISDSSRFGSVNWTFDSGSENFSYLSSGESLVLTYVITLTDENAATDTQNITITINGVNEAPIFGEDESAVTNVLVFSKLDMNGDDATPGVGTENANLASIIQYFINDADSGSSSNEDGTYINSYTDYDFSTFNVDSSLTSFSDPDLASKLASASFLFMPDMESGFNISTDLPDSAKTILADWVNDGGVLMMTGTSGSLDATFLNAIFGWDTSSVSYNSSLATLNTDTAAGTPFEGGPASLTGPSATDMLNGGTVEGFTPIYGTEDAALVATISEGAGTVIYLGFDFFNTGIAGTGYVTESGNTNFVNDVSTGGEAGDDWVQQIIPRALQYSAVLSSSTTLVETDSTLSTSGTLPLVDIDLGDTVTTSYTVTAVQKDATDTVISSDALEPDNSTLLDMLNITATPIDSSSTTGSVIWEFNTNGFDGANLAESFDYLAAGESLILTYTITASDGALSDSIDVVITIVGTNDNPIITVEEGDSNNVSAAETNTTVSITGSLTVTDYDTTNTVSVDTYSVVASGTTSGLTATNAQLLDMLNLDETVIITDSTNVGEITGEFNSGTQYFDYLAEGETLVLTYTGRVTDSSGGYGDGTVVINITGSNDAPTITSVTNGTLTEAIDASSQNLSTTGTISFNDIDVSNTVDVTVAFNNDTAWSTGGEIDSNLATLLESGLTIISGNDVAAPGSVTWSYSVTGANLDFLAAGETITLSFNVTVTDNDGLSATDTVTITIKGINDAPTISNPASVTVTEDVPFIFTGENLIAFGDLDTSDVITTATISVTDGTGTLNVVDGTGATVLNDGTKTVQISGTVEEVNKALDGMIYTPTLDANGVDYSTLNISVTDGKATATSSLTIDVTAVDDNPVANAMAATVAPESKQTFAEFQPNFFDVDNNPMTEAIQLEIMSLPATGVFEYYTGGVDGDRSDDSNWVTITNISSLTVAAGNTQVDGRLVISMMDLNDYRFNAGANSGTSTTVDWRVMTLGNTTDASYDSTGTQTDVGGWSNTATGIVTILSAEANTVPTVNIFEADGTTSLNDGSITISEDATSNTIVLKFTDTETPDQYLQGIVQISNTDLIDMSGISMIRTSDDTIEMTFTPTENMYGTTTITLGAFDGIASSTQSFTLVVESVNDTPIGSDFTKDVDEDSTFFFYLLNPGDIYQDPNDVNTDADNPLVDGYYETQMGIIQSQMGIILNPESSEEAIGDAQYILGGVVTDLVDKNYFPQTFVIETLPSHGDLYLGETKIEIDVELGNYSVDIMQLSQLVYKPDPDFNSDDGGVDTFTWHAIDQGGLITDTKVATFTVLPTNDAPYFGDLADDSSEETSSDSSSVLSPTVTQIFDNADFENGLDGWTSQDATVVEGTTKITFYANSSMQMTDEVKDILGSDSEMTWVIDGSDDYMVKLEPSGSSSEFNTSFQDVSGISDDSMDYITDTFYESSSMTPTNIAYITKTFEATAGDTYEIAWNYVSGDYVPWNDGSVLTFVNNDDPNNTAVLDGIQAEVALLGATNEGTSNYTTQSYGSTGWQTSTIQVLESGSYTLTLAVFNLGDTALNPYLLIDNIAGTTTLNGETFEPLEKDENAPEPAGEAVVVSTGLIETNSSLTDTGTVDVTDIDTGDIVNLTATPISVTAVQYDIDNNIMTSDSLQPTPLELLSMFEITPDSPAILASEYTKELTWNFDSDSEAFDYLAENEKLVITYTVTATDSEGATDTQDITVTITGTNDAPTITVVENSTTIIEDSVLSDNGSITFADLDTTNRPVATYSVKSITSTDVTLTSSQIANLEEAFSIENIVTNTNNGTVTLDYTIANEDISFLNEGETITAVFTLTVTDDSGASVSQDMTVTIQGANSAPVLEPLKTIYYTDTDSNDTFADTLGTAIASDLDANAVLTFGIDEETSSTSTTVTKTLTYGEITIDKATGEYTFVPYSDVINQLSSNQTETVTITVTDDKAAVSSQVLTIDIQSVNDAPLLMGESTGVTFTENGTAVSIYPNLIIDDLEGTSYDTGSLTFSTTLNGEIEDNFVIREIGGITVSGDEVSYAGVVIGTINSSYDGLDGEDLRIDLNENAFSAQVQALARAIGFLNETDDLSDLSREITITVNDGGNGGETTARYSEITTTVAITTINDLPEITLSSSNYEVEKVIGVNDDGTLQLESISFADKDHTELTITFETTLYGILTINDSVQGGLSSLDISNNGTQSVTLTGTIEEINETLAASDGITYVAGYGNDIVTPGLDFLKVTALDALSGESVATKAVMILPAVPNADSDNIVGYEDETTTVDLETLIHDINDHDGYYTLGTGTADITNELGVVTTNGNIVEFDGNEIYDGEELIGYTLDNGTLILNSGIMGSDSGIFTFTPNENWNGTESFVYTYTSGDGETSLIGQINVFVVPINDAPTLDVPNAQIINEDTALIFNDTNENLITFNDLANEIVGDMQLTLSVVNGTITLSDDSTLTYASGSNGSSILTINGSLEDLQAAIDGLIYQGNQDYYGNDTLTVTINDLGNSGNGTALSETKTISITVNPVNDAPNFVDETAETSGSITEGSGVYSQSGTIAFIDVDVTNTPVVTFETKSITWKGQANNTLSLSSSQYDDFNDAFSISENENNTNVGNVSWDYTITDDKLDFLAEGETVTVVYTLTVKDSDGEIDTKDVTITITGTNDTPDITVDLDSGDSNSAAILESDSTLTTAGTLSVEDLDTTDVITTSHVVSSVQRDSHGNVMITDVKEPLNSVLKNMLTITHTPIDGTTQNGVISWTFNSNGEAFNYLATGETLTLTYTITASDDDSSLANDSQTVTITITGTNDGPTLDENSDLYFQIGFGETLEPINLKEQFNFGDLDTTDKFTFTVYNVPPGFVVDADTGILSGSPTQSGPFTITVRGTDIDGAFIEKSFDMLVIAPPAPEAPAEEAPAEETVEETDTTANRDNTANKDGEGTNGDEGLDITRTELTTIVRDGNGNDQGTVITAGFTVDVADNGQIQFNDESNQAFETVGLVVERMEIIQDQIEIEVIDTRVGQKYIATLADGTDLPDTLSFDPNTGVIKGTLPAGMEELEISIKALSDDGTTRILNIKIDINELRKKAVEAAKQASYETLKDQIVAQNYQMTNYGSYVTSLFS